MALINGKGYYIWKIPSCEGGDPEAIALVAQQAGLQHVFIKIANGIYDYNFDSASKKDLVAPVCEALLAKGIRVWGWHYVFGDLPKEEAKAAIRQISRLPLDGYIIDAESEYKDKYTPCRIFMNELRGALPDYPVALSSFRYPNYHMSLPWKDFLSKCDFNMPQVYWEQAHNPGEQLTRSLKEFQLIEPFRPIIPTGAAYAAGGWVPTTDDIRSFLDTAVSLNMPAASFWSWDYCRVKLPAIWQAIADYTWPGSTTVIPTIPELFVEYLSNKNIPLILSLYDDAAVFVTSKQTIQGKNALNGWYSALLSTLYADATFTLDSFSGSESTMKMIWKIKTNDGSTFSIADTLGIQEKKILYHYSSIQY
jgi:hypothetical protein